MKTIAIANLKGGTGKTTSAAYLAHAFQQLGRSVLIVDADPQAQLLSWSERADFPMPAIWLPDQNLHRKLAGITAGKGYDVAIIDTPPIYEHARGKDQDQEQRRAHGIVLSALRAADAVLVPLSPSMMELEGVPRILEAIAQAAAARGDAGPAVRVSLNRTVWNLGMNRVTRRQLVALGCQVLTTEIPFKPAHVGQAYGGPISGQLHGYFSVAKDMENAQ
jgi:chromosome partitioning protein